MKKTVGGGRVDLVIKALEEGESDDPVVAFLHGDGQLDPGDAESALVAIEAARRLGRGDRLLAIKDATSIKAVRKAAAEAIHRLRSTGHEVIEEPTRSWSMAGEIASYPPPTALLGMPLQDGYFPYAVMSYGAEGGVICAGLAGPTQGFKDDEHAHMGRSKARQTWDDLARKSGWFEVPFHAALFFAETAFKEADGKFPNGWAHVLENVAKEDQDGARMFDPLRDQEQEIDDAALKNVDDLLDGEHRVAMMLDEQGVVWGIEQMVELQKSPLELSEATKRERVADIVRTSADRGLTKQTRATWALALDVTAYLCKRLGNDEMRKAARSTALAVRAGKAGSEIPYVRAMVERLLEPLSRQDE
jgi:hypothetical protein